MGEHGQGADQGNTPRLLDQAPVVQGPDHRPRPKGRPQQAGQPGLKGHGGHFAPMAWTREGTQGENSPPARPREASRGDDVPQGDAKRHPQQAAEQSFFLHGSHHPSICGSCGCSRA